MKTQKLFIRIIFNGMKWEKTTSYNPEDEGDYESVVEKEQEAWIEFMTDEYPSFKKDWKKHQDTYDIELYDIDEL